MKKRMTNQKRIILEYLKSTKDHPSAEMIFKKVKKKLPQISLGTVYRILNEFKEEGKIVEIPEKVSRFDGNTLPHAHFICQKCKRIYDVFEDFKILKKKKLKVGKINNFQIFFYGICKKCSRK
jgi:Fe2+ or Zn2+ uptake regulation protein